MKQYCKPIITVIVISTTDVLTGSPNVMDNEGDYVGNDIFSLGGAE